MPSRSVHDAHILQQLRRLHGSLLEVMAAMNRPQRDEMLIEAAGISLDRVLFPLLIAIQRFGPIGIVNLAGRMGRDYTTVSRQVTRLEQLGLAERRADPADKRVRQAAVTASGREMTGRIDAARDRIALAALEDWDRRDIDELVRLMGKLAGALASGPVGSGG